MNELTDDGRKPTGSGEVPSLEDRLPSFFWNVYLWMAAGLALAGGVAVLIQHLWPDPELWNVFLALGGELLLAAILYFLIKAKHLGRTTLIILHLSFSAFSGAAFSLMLFFCNVPYMFLLGSAFFGGLGLAGRVGKIRLGLTGLMVLTALAATVVVAGAFLLHGRVFASGTAAAIALFLLVVVVGVQAKDLRRMHVSMDPPVHGALRLLSALVFGFIGTFLGAVFDSSD